MSVRDFVNEGGRVSVLGVNAGGSGTSWSTRLEGLSEFLLRR